MEQLTTSELIKVHSGSYVKNYHQKDTSRISRLIHKIYIDNRDVVLDVGCGNGLLIPYLAPKVKQYTGIDFSKDFIREATKVISDGGHDNCNLIEGDIIKYVANNSDSIFDKIFALDFVEHLYDDMLLDIFSTLYTTLDTTGSLFIHTPNGDYFMEILKGKGIIQQTDGHIGIRTGGQYTSLFESIGYKVTVSKIAHYNILKHIHWLRYLPFLGKYFEARLFITLTK